jgi:hypothetical protein
MPCSPLVLGHSRKAFLKLRKQIETRLAGGERAKPEIAVTIENSSSTQWRAVEVT